MARTLASVPTGEFFSIPEITDPTTFTERELMRAYAKRRREMSENIRRESLAVLEDLARLRPEKLPTTFLARGAFSSKGWQTDHGSWVPVPKKVSSVGNMVGVKTTLEFKPNEGTKVDIGQMAIYNWLVRHADGMFMHESSALCCVFPKGKGPAPDPFKDFVAPPLGEWKEDIRNNFDATKFCPISVEDYGVDGSNKRKKGSGWEGYTKIYTIDPDRLYAACNHCTTMLKLKANSGTGSQTKHNSSCLFKKQHLMATSMDTPSIDSGASSLDTPTA